jgi:plasmid stabilization system protein ParE
MFSHTALKYDVQVKEDSHVELTVPFPAGTYLTVFVIEAEDACNDLLRQFDRVALSQGEAQATLLAQLVQEYAQRSAQHQEIGRMTLAALGIEPHGTRRKRAFNARKVARALRKAYATGDAVEIVNRCAAS